MRPPRLTTEQKEIEDALLRSVISSDIRFKYPKNGEYRSAFIFYDIDNDKMNEALVFYCAGNNDYARLSVLDQNEDGTWAPLCELPGLDRNVEFVSFEHITNTATVDIVIGWSGNASEQHRLGVYSLQNGTLQNRLDDEFFYSTYLIDDMDANGLSEIFLLSGDTGTRQEVIRTLSLLSFDGYGVTLAGIQELSTSIAKFAGVCAGRLSPKDPQRAIFIDEHLLEDILVTEVFTIEDGSLEPIIWADMSELLMPEDEPSESDDADAAQEEDTGPLNTLYRLTMREDTSAVCADLDEDGIIDLPISTLLPGYQDMEKAEKIYLTEYVHLVADRFTRVFAAVVNRNSGYLLRFPDSWIGKVTISNQPENNEWHFILYDEALENPLENLSGELARIRVVSQKDYQDKFIENYRILATRSAFTYYGYVPDTAPGPLSVSIDRLANELFALL